MVSAQVAAFRRTYRRDAIGTRYRPIVHLSFTFGMGLGVIGYAIASLEQVGALEWLTVPVTFLYANLSEYFGHRGPMHHPLRGLGIVYRRHAGQHHRFFTDRDMALEETRDLKAVLFPAVMIGFFLVAFALPAGLLLGWLTTPNVAWLFVATAVGYFLNYEFLHLAYHLPEGSLPARGSWLRRLRRLHQAHHDPRLMARYNFNITYPIGDALFGTRWRAAESGGDADAGTSTTPRRTA